MQNIERAKILSISYNRITIKPARKPTKIIYVDGLQKRILSGVSQEQIKRYKYLYYTADTPFWDTGIAFVEQCDVCRSDLVDDGMNYHYKDTCVKCGSIVCPECFCNGYCKKCGSVKMLEELAR